MAWNESSPAGSDSIKFGDNEIRQMKADVRQYLAEEHVALTDVPSTLKGSHKFQADTTGARPAADAASRRIFFNQTKRQLEMENVDQTLPAGTPAWFAGGFPLFPTGTTLVFYQASPPAGWTAVSPGDRALRVVAGATTGGTGGGSTAFSTAFAAGASGSTALGTHFHGIVETVQYNGFAAAAGGGATVVNVSGFNKSATTDLGGHTHTLPSSDLLYSDVIFASKD